MLVAEGVVIDAPAFTGASPRSRARCRSRWWRPLVLVVELDELLDCPGWQLDGYTVSIGLDTDQCVPVEEDVGAVVVYPAVHPVISLGLMY